MQSPDIVPLVSPAELDVLASALRDLPQVGPDESSWDRIAPLLESAAAASAPRRRATSRWMPLAAAASLAVVSGWLGLAGVKGLATHPADAPRGTVAAGSSGSERQSAPSAAQAALIQRSSSLERWLVDSGSAQWPQDIGSASASVEIENLIANVDQRLTRSASDAERDRLWQRRVGLLEQLVTLQGEPLALSMSGTPAQMLL